MTNTAKKLDITLLPDDARNELFDFYQFLLQKHKRLKRKRLGKLTEYPLRGLPFRYELPFDPVAEGEWEALQ
jgi:hypothetical protein